MKLITLLLVCACLLIAAALAEVATASSSRASARTGERLSEPCSTVQACRNEIAKLKRAVAWQRDQARRLHRPSVDEAIATMAFAAGIGESTMRRVARCESRFFPLARNGQYLGLFQLGPMHLRSAIVRRFGWSSPYANAAQTAAWVRVHGWSRAQWSCF